MEDGQKKDLFDNCVYDSCHLNDFETVMCEHAASMAKICSGGAYEVIVTWRSNDLCREFYILLHYACEVNGLMLQQWNVAKEWNTSHVEAFAYQHAKTVTVRNAETLTDVRKVVSARKVWYLMVLENATAMTNVAAVLTGSL